MPTYQYACTACDERLEVVQKFSDAPLTECPACEGRLRKVFSAVGVVFKGSGFYRTDSRKDAVAASTKTGSGESSSSGAAASSGSTGSTGSSGSSGSTGSSDKPAASSSSSGGEGKTSSGSSKTDAKVA